MNEATIQEIKELLEAKKPRYFFVIGVDYKGKPFCKSEGITEDTITMKIKIKRRKSE